MKECFKGSLQRQTRHDTQLKESPARLDAVTYIRSSPAPSYMLEKYTKEMGHTRHQGLGILSKIPSLRPTKGQATLEDRQNRK